MQYIILWSTSINVIHITLGVTTTLLTHHSVIIFFEGNVLDYVYIIPFFPSGYWRSMLSTTSYFFSLMLLSTLLLNIRSSSSNKWFAVFLYLSCPHHTLSYSSLSWSLSLLRGLAISDLRFRFWEKLCGMKTNLSPTKRYIHFRPISRQAHMNWIYTAIFHFWSDQIQYVKRNQILKERYSEQIISDHLQQYIR